MNVQRTKRVTTFLCLLMPFFLTPVFAENSVVEKAISHADRPPKDIQRDATRKPAEVLSFFEIKPGMHVLENFAGGGYYTQILSYVVGEKGKVVAHNNQAYLDYAAKELEKRSFGHKFNNVVQMKSENNQLSLKSDQFDAALFILAFHDFFLTGSDFDWDPIDPDVILKEIFQSLKSGAVLGIVDHIAASGSPDSVGGTLHRIDPQSVRAWVEKAGFVFDGQAHFLENTTDDLTLSMGNPKVKGKTSRFVYRFKKP